jgi:hypothetical protein
MTVDRSLLAVKPHEYRLSYPRSASAIGGERYKASEKPTLKPVQLPFLVEIPYLWDGIEFSFGV